MTRKTVYSKDFDILCAISEIYLKGQWFDLDPTFSKGVIYQSKDPAYKFDILPTRDDVSQGDCRDLSFKDNEINSIVFDPPFLFRNDITKITGQAKAQNVDKMCSRFSYFQNFQELISMYSSSLMEFHRILIPRGILVFKCQDFTDGSGTRPFYDTHCKVIQLARAYSFSLQDIAILVKPNKLILKGAQGCFRKIHSYYLVFKKEPKKLKYMKNLEFCDDEVKQIKQSRSTSLFFFKE